LGSFFEVEGIGDMHKPLLSKQLKAFLMIFKMGSFGNFCPQISLIKDKGPLRMLEKL